MIKLLCVGTMKEKGMNQLAKDYQSRIDRFTKFEVIEVKEAKVKTIEQDKILQEEATNLMKHIRSDDFVVTLDLQGNMIDSIELSNHLEKWMMSSLVFVIGGSWGLSPQIKQRANFAWKMSDLTFPHLLARIMVLEQIYRGFKILGNQSYHK